MARARRNWKALVATLGLAAAFWPAASRADVWGFIDARGVAHFASSQVDERYTLFYKGDESFDTRSGIGAFNPPPELRPEIPAKLQTFFEVSPTYKLVLPHLREAAARHGIEIALLQALIVAESGFDRAAISPKGAVGLMQIMPATAERYGLVGDDKTPIEAKLSDPKTNIGIGTRYLRFLLDLFPGQLELALASYNAGEGAVQRAGNRIPNYKETQDYVRTVTRLYQGLKPAPESRRLQQPQRVHVELPGRLPTQLAQQQP